MIRYYTRQANQVEFRQVTDPHAAGMWAHAEQPQDDEMQQFIRDYALDANIVRDIRDMDELPRVEQSNGHLYVFLRAVQRTKHGEALTSPFLAIIGDSQYVTMSSSNAMTDRKIMMATPEAVDTAHVGAMLLATIAAVLDDYENQVRRTGKYVRDIGRRLRTHEVDNTDFVHFVVIEDNLNEYAHNLNGMLVVAERLRGGTYPQLATDRNLESLDDLILHMRQLISAVNGHAQSLTSIRNAYSTIANNVLNERMKLLTVLTVLIALPNVFYGMYGMNVVLPFAEQPWAYSVIVGFTVVVMAVVYLLARRFRIF